MNNAWAKFVIQVATYLVTAENATPRVAPKAISAGKPSACTQVHFLYFLETFLVYSFFANCTADLDPDVTRHSFVFAIKGLKLWQGKTRKIASLSQPKAQLPKSQCLAFLFCSLCDNNETNENFFSYLRAKPITPWFYKTQPNCPIFPGRNFQFLAASLSVSGPEGPCCEESVLLGTDFSTKSRKTRNFRGKFFVCRWWSSCLTLPSPRVSVQLQWTPKNSGLSGIPTWFLTCDYPGFRRWLPNPVCWVCR